MRSSTCSSPSSDPTSGRMVGGRHRAPAWCTLIIALACCLLAGEVNAASMVPTGFQMREFGGTLDVVAQAIAADGRVFIAEKAGRIRVLENDVLVTAPLITPGEFLSTIDTRNERGLIGIALDPDFATNHYIYVHYTFAANGTAPARNRISRITEANNRLVAGSEMVLLDLDPLNATKLIHNGGALNFALDGTLLVAVGNNDIAGSAQSLGSLSGKILRIKRNVPSKRSDGTYDYPSDNPFVSNAAVGARYKAIYAYGFRNPFSAAVQPVTGKYYANDIGEYTASWEEINDVLPGANYGYQAGVVPKQAPLFTYHRNGHTASFPSGPNLAITGGAFHPPGSSWPASYHGRYFFCDFSQGTSGWIRYLDGDPMTSNSDKNGVTYFVNNVDHPLDLKFSASGDLYYLTRGSAPSNDASTSGKLVRVRYLGGPLPVPNRLAFTSTPTAVGANVTLAAVRVEVRDAANVRVPGAVHAVTLALQANPGSATLNGTKTVNAVDGVATFSNLSISAAGTAYTLRATSGTLTAAISSPINVLGSVATPVIGPSSPVWSGPVHVTMTCATPGAVIRYVVVPSGDASVPGSSSPIYDPAAPPLVAASNRTVKAIATLTGLTTSALAQMTYTGIGPTPYGLQTRPPRPALTLSQTAPPTRLSDTGLLAASFGASGSLAVANGLIPYQVNSPLWSDGAHKQRWMSLRNGSQIDFNATGEWSFPDGTVLVKHFDLPIDDTDPTRLKRLETRVLVIPDGGVANTYGLTYKWNAAGTDAELINETLHPSGLDETQTITTSSGTRTQVWHYPSRGQCMECHTPASGVVLGLKTRQLNGSMLYPGTGVSDHQLRTLNYLGLFKTNIGDAPPATMSATYHKLVPVKKQAGDTQAVLENRVKSYLDSNCAMCHRPGGVNAAWSGLYGTAMASQGLINVAPTAGHPLMEPDSVLVKPGDLTHSWLYARVHSTVKEVAMPPLGRNVRDQDADDTIAAWINGLLPPLDRLTISPGNRTVALGTSGQFSVVAKRADGSVITPNPPFVWSTLGAGGGIAANPANSAIAVFSATAASGMVKVIARTTVAGVTKSAEVWVTLAAGSTPVFTSVVVSPATATVAAGATRTFTALARDQSGTALTTQPPMTWSVSGTGGAISASGVFSATAASGTITVTATATVGAVTRTGSAMVTLAPASPVFTSVVVTPATSSVTPGASAALNASARDQNGTALASQPTFSWQTSGGGTIAGTGMFSATTIGGPFTITATATVGGVTRSGTATITVVAAATAVAINFQPAGAPTVAGYLVDSGKPFGDRGNGQRYGWSSETTSVPLDISSTTRDRNLTSDQLRDTLVHMQKPGLAANWKIALPNGHYQVFVVAGDPKDVDSVYRISVAGIPAVAGTPSATGLHWFESLGLGGITVQVTDGHLRVTNGSGAVNNKLCFIEIVPIGSGNG